MWDLPRPGLEPVSPALAGRFSATAPPGNSGNAHFDSLFYCSLLNNPWVKLAEVNKNHPLAHLQPADVRNRGLVIPPRETEKRQMLTVSGDDDHSENHADTNAS